MALIYQKRIVRQDLKDNPNSLYVFGDNVERKGYRGQAREMRGEPNAIGVATKWRPSLQEDAFFSDDRFDEIVVLMERDLLPVFEAVKRARRVVWPEDGIGTGLSQLPTRAPNIWRELEAARLLFERM